jgi:hypothetical protein
MERSSAIRPALLQPPPVNPGAVRGS